MKNLTYKFIEPLREYHSSESRWSTILQIALIWLSEFKNEPHVKIYNSINGELIDTKNIFEIYRWTNENSVVEGKLNGYLFNNNKWANAFLNLSPDVVRFDPKLKEVIFIEVKTVGASVKKNIELYKELNNYMISCGWRSRLFYLMSHGHEIHSDWQLLQKVNASILIWEELLSLLLNSPIEKLIGSDLASYCTLPICKATRLVDS